MIFKMATGGLVWLPEWIVSGLLASVFKGSDEYAASSLIVHRPAECREDLE